MDILAHALYGATLFSRTGLAGGHRGAAACRGSFAYDWTVWAAAAFSVLPDLGSIGLSFAEMMLRGQSPSFHGLPSHVFLLYHGFHSLVIAGVVVALLFMWARPVAVPAFAWPLHVLMDSLSHGDGRWQTLLLYPVSDWHFHGMNWWQAPGLMLAYWSALPMLWLGIRLWRRRSASARPLS